MSDIVSVLDSSLVPASQFPAKAGSFLPALVSNIATRARLHDLGYWVIQPLFRKMSYEDFSTITQAFGENAQRIFGTPCDVSIQAASRAPMTMSLNCPEMFASMEVENAADRILDIGSLRELGQQKKVAGPEGAAGVEPAMKKMWREAPYICVNIKPIDNNAMPPSMWAKVTFCGNSASFFVQPHDASDGPRGEKGFDLAEPLAANMRDVAKQRGLIFLPIHRPHEKNMSDGFADAYFADLKR